MKKESSFREDVVATILLLVAFAIAAAANVNALAAAAAGFTSPVHALLLCRHGDSVWNGGHEGQVETFTGWTDVPLSPTGEQEAKEMGEQIGNYFYDIDACFTSMLRRSQQTTSIVLETLWHQRQTGIKGVPYPRIVHCDYQLNERHYGALQGLAKRDVEAGLYANELPGSDNLNVVTAWRRSWYAVPPQLTDDDPRRMQELQKWKCLLAGDCGGGNVRGDTNPNRKLRLESKIPRGESLEMVAKQRVRPFLNNFLTPVLNQCAAHKTAQQKQSSAAVTSTTATGMVVAHANSLRALLGVLCEVEDDPEALDVLEALKIPTGVPLVIYYQQLNNGRYRACDLPDKDECIVHYDNGLITHPRAPPPHLGHPKLPVWPLDLCIPLKPYHQMEQEESNNNKYDHDYDYGSLGQDDFEFTFAPPPTAPQVEVPEIDLVSMRL